MKKIIGVLLLLNIAAVSTAQLDTSTLTSADSLYSIDALLKRELFSLPFNKEEIDALQKKTEIISLKEAPLEKQYLFLVLLNFFTITVLLLNFSRAKVKKNLASLFNLNMLKQFSLVEIKRENKYLWAYFLLLLLYLALLIYILANTFEKDLDVWFLSVAFFIFFLFDLLVNLVSAYILNQKENHAIVLFNNASFLFLSITFFIVSSFGLVFLPQNLNVYYAYFFLFGFVFIYTWKFVRNIFILNSNKIKIFSFYFFLYLCTFKILPIAVLVKTILKELIK